MKVSFATVKAAMQGRELDFLRRYLNEKQLNGHNQPCPRCGGRDRYRHIKKSDGGFYCSSFESKMGDVFDHVAHTQGMTMAQVLQDAAVFCNLDNPTPEQKREERERRERIAIRAKKLEMLNYDRLQMRGIMNVLFTEAANKSEPTERELQSARDLINMIKRTYAKHTNQEG